METEGEEPPQLGRRVAVYGGGNTAVDVARTVKRLGADEPVIVYRRSPQAQMPAHDFEMPTRREEEGVVVNWLRTITANRGGDASPSSAWSIDENGFARSPRARLETMEADTLVMALGQNVDQTGLLTSLAGGRARHRDGVVQVGRST